MQNVSYVNNAIQVFQSVQDQWKQLKSENTGSDDREWAAKVNLATGLLELAKAIKSLQNEVESLRNTVKICNP